MQPSCLPFIASGAERVIWMRVTNETEYRAWNPRHNGVKRQAAGANFGFFGAINLLGPRDPNRIQTATPANKLWFATFTAVQLKFEFLAEASAGSYEAARAINRQGHGELSMS